MKVSMQAVTEVTEQKLNPPLPLEVEPPSKEDKTKITCFKLQTTPTDVDSLTYSFTMRKLDGSKNLCQAIQFAYYHIDYFSSNSTCALRAFTLLDQAN
jgi:hypothetical protein